MLRAWAPVLALATAWALLPALPALFAGELLGSPWTALYPSAWGLWWFASEQPGLPLHSDQLAALDGGMPFYYSSPIHGWLAWPMIPLLGVPLTWNVQVLLARLATPLVTFGAARAWGLKDSGALVAAAVYGCAPFFHGYAVEGIVEGLDGWTLPLFVWLVLREQRAWAAVAFFLVILSSWYLGAVGCVLALVMGRRAWPSAAAGFGIALPFVWAFAGAFPGQAGVGPEIQRMMGTSLVPAMPGLVEDNPFAKTSWIGLVAPVLALLVARERRWEWAALALFVVLSLGWGPWYHLPGLSSLRFPYRWMAGALLLLGGLAGLGAQRWKHGAWLAPVIVLEGLLLSPIEPVIPGAPAEIHPVYDQVAGPVRDLPGPMAVEPGRINPSRPWSRWFLYQQTGHGHGTTWAPDFNSVGVEAASGDQAAPYVVVHRDLLPQPDEVEAGLVADGYIELDRQGDKRLYGMR